MASLRKKLTLHFGKKISKKDNVRVIALNKVAIDKRQTLWLRKRFTEGIRIIAYIEYIEGACVATSRWLP